MNKIWSSPFSYTANFTFQLMSLEDGIARIEKGISYLRGVVEQMGKRLGRLENEIVHLRKDIGDLRGTWITIFYTLLPILLKLLGLL